MKLYIDLETRELIEGPGFRSPVTSLKFKRGDAARLEVAFLSNGLTHTSLGDPAHLELSFAAKARNRFDLDYLVHATDWTLPGPGDVIPVYQCSPSFNTVGLNTALGVGTESELAETTLMGEIAWGEGDGEPTSTRTFVVVVENDVIRGDGDDPIPAGKTVSDFALTFLDDATAAEARATLGVPERSSGGNGAADEFKVPMYDAAGGIYANMLQARAVTAPNSAVLLADDGYTSGTLVLSDNAGKSVVLQATGLTTNRTLELPNTNGTLLADTTAAAALGLGTAATRNVGTASGTVCAGNDARLGILAIHTFSAPYSGTLTLPANAQFFSAVIVGGGGGGGSGRRGATATNRFGGGGAAGGGYAMLNIRPINLLSPVNNGVAMEVGAGGAGGLAVTTDSTDGNSGAPGTRSKLGPFIAPGGNPGSGGTGAAGAAGTLVSGSVYLDSSAQGSNSGGGAGSSSTGSSGTGSATFCSAGGGGGGGISSANTSAAGGAGGYIGTGSSSYVPGSYVSGGGPGAANAGNGSAGSQSSLRLVGSGGGGGGAGTTAGGSGGLGAAGGSGGGGGGGGGASLNGWSSGAGGAGGAGCIQLVLYGTTEAPETIV